MRNVLAVAAFGAAILAGCADNNHGMTQTRPDARPFAEAHSECWTAAMNNAGNAATGAQVRAYDACMARQGWADTRTF